MAHHSRFGKQGKRQTSFAAVEVLPWNPSAAFELDQSDVDITTYAGSSKGGQHANKSATNVRAVHRPTGVSATSEGRSQQANRQQALTVLAARLRQRQADEEAAARGEPVAADFGTRVRSYVFTPYQLVSDERCGFKTRKLDRFLAGDMDALFDALKTWRLSA